MKSRKIILACVILSIGFILLLYPILGEYHNEKYQSNVYAAYTKKVFNINNTNIEKELDKSYEYNKRLAESVVKFENVFKNKNIRKDEYYNLLNVTEDGVMAYIDIPVINVHLPIYHGTDEDVLKKGVGHLAETSLPVGGKSTHAVLSGHTGLSNAKLFTDLNQMKKNDFFYLYVYNKKLTYIVDSIRIVEPDDISYLNIEKGKDYVTLITCTPYGINSHRLLVRGRRYNVNSDKKAEIKSDKISDKNQSNRTIISTWTKYYMAGIAAGTIGIILIVVIWFVIRYINKKRW